MAWLFQSAGFVCLALFRIAFAHEVENDIDEGVKEKRYGGGNREKKIPYVVFEDHDRHTVDCEPAKANDADDFRGGNPAVAEDDHHGTEGDLKNAKNAGDDV